MQMQLPFEDRDQLGEGPVFDDRAGVLWWVDISGGIVHRWSPATGERSSMHFEREVSAVILTEDEDTIVVAQTDELRRCGPAGQETLARLDTGAADLRFNDCRVDPWGRLFAGTLDKGRRPVAALHRLEDDGTLRPVAEQVTISNGIGWSPAGDVMYYVDSMTQRIDVFDYDGATGTPSGRRPWAEIDPDDGLPDGLAVDVEGGVWICLFGGSRLHHYTADGRLADEIRLPVTNPTCPAFGGADLTTMFVTSARHRLSEAQLEAEPTAGALLVFEPGVAGLPTNQLRSQHQ